MLRLQRISCISLFSLFVMIMMISGIVSAAEQPSANKEKEPAAQGAADNNEEIAAVEDKDEGFVYDPTKRIDPFQSFIAAMEEKEEEEKRPKTYLETLELSQLDLVLIAIGPEGKWAIVKDSKDVGHMIKEGTRIGTRGGVVYKIKEGEVIIREEYRDFRGQMQYREIIKETASSSQTL
jgi:Tfp pilus assembly protein PilP